MRETPDIVELLGLVPYSSRPPQRKIRAAALAAVWASPDPAQYSIKGESHEPTNHRQMASHYRLRVRRAHRRPNRGLYLQRNELRTLAAHRGRGVLDRAIVLFQRGADAGHGGRRGG